MKNSKGFTLIELVVVIVILGILAAVALPRFMNATKDAHRSAVEGAGGALASAVVLVRSQWEVNRSKGVANPNTNVAGFGDGTVDVNASGWPLGTGGALNCVQLWSALLQGSAPTVAAAAGTGIDYVATSSGNDCVYTYQADGGNDTITYESTNGTVNTVFTE
ncbi:type II secretion system protein [Pseudomonas sp. PDM15]|jgi:MSHA pilin protein MshB|uniref:type II secretion system protein n=1 Tax=Pseudomonas sp. PDM15 TaxID=2769303 RepID=UPI00177FB130|nr:type II secretion system protein [Pseudomonas sp. PDM15]MBD9427265.1 type II secretion system protein [Pseudomonas sp. PDM15]